ncbi:aminotransferase class I/II-fold pyridoxal phosphate-dependent enzyme [Pararoseomonas sp. SCSIO 73927]|uniref:aminotransferase class I/II-fold pyridoxal phosphate-dependent enzyme n=1 Tax=Pararoseomonas sp. SCSIO 73927 TaxID=3114537 RepID=UPI0030CF3A80
MNQGLGLSATARLALLNRLSKRRARQEESGAGDGRSFSDVPGLRDFELLKTAMEALDLPNPFFRPHQGVAGATTTIGNEEYLNFSSYNYLGLNDDPRVKAAAHAAIERHGVSASASRVVSGERPLHAELEGALAAHYGAEDAITLVSGHATNVTVIGHLMGPRDVILHDAMIHNSCVEGARLSGARRIAFAHNDAAAAERELAAARRGAGRALILVEGHYSMDGDVPDLARFIEIARRHDAWLMVDEAHSMGVLGATGHGIAELQGVDPAGVDIWMGTLSKTLCSCGGYVAARRQLINWLRHTAPGFVYSVGLAPVLAASALQSLSILHEEPWRVAKLNANAARFRDGLRARGLDAGASAGHAIVPLMTGSSVRAGRLSAELFERGVNVQPITFPAVPERAARLRFFLTAAHTEAQIDRTLDIVAETAAGVAPAEVAG